MSLLLLFEELQLVRFHLVMLSRCTNFLKLNINIMTLKKMLAHQDVFFYPKPRILKKYILFALKITKMFRKRNRQELYNNNEVAKGQMLDRRNGVAWGRGQGIW